MKFLFLSALLSFPAWAQLEKPILEGKCGRVSVKIQNDILRAEIPNKKSGSSACNFKRVDGTNSMRPRPNATIYVAPDGCIAKVNPNAFLKVISLGKTGTGLFSVYADKEALVCQFNVLDWDKVKKLSTKGNL